MPPDPCRHTPGGRWFVDETYVRVAGQWRYVYRAIDENGQVIDVYVSPRRDASSARAFFTRAIAAHGEPTKITTDKAWALARAIHDTIPGAWHRTDQYATNRIESDARLKARLRPMRGLKTDRSARTMIRGHAFVQNLRRGHYELGINARPLRSTVGPRPTRAAVEHRVGVAVAPMVVSPRRGRVVRRARGTRLGGFDGA